MKQNEMSDVFIAYWTRQSFSLFINGKNASALKCRDYKDFTDIIQTERVKIKNMDEKHESVSWDGTNIVGTLTVNNAGGNQRMPDKDNFNAILDATKTPRKYILRRLTPVECARLQGFPDWWCDGADGSDSAQYRLWGNGVALPCVADLLGRIVKEIRMEEDNTK